MAPAAPSKTAFDPSVIALISLALGSLAAAGASILVFLGKFEAWQIPLVIVGIMLVISSPSMAIAWLKLRNRNLGPILDANGWAVNAKARMNVPFGGALTGVAALPPGATFGAADKFAEKPSVWPKLLAVAFVVWFIWAFLNDSQGRLYGWAENYPAIQHYATPPSKEVSERREAAKKAAKEKAEAEAKAAAAEAAAQSAVAGANTAASATNAIPAK